MHYRRMTTPIRDPAHLPTTCYSPLPLLKNVTLSSTSGAVTGCYLMAFTRWGGVTDCHAYRSTTARVIPLVVLIWTGRATTCPDLFALIRSVEHYAACHLYTTALPRYLFWWTQFGFSVEFGTDTTGGDFFGLPLFAALPPTDCDCFTFRNHFATPPSPHSRTTYYLLMICSRWRHSVFVLYSLPPPGSGPGPYRHTGYRYERFHL